ncbi:MAG: 50S ribosomal protein L40e [Candidatus Aenigmatarchaeota archaeon]
MPKKIPDFVAKRLFINMFVCMKCNAKMRAEPSKVKAGKIKCRKCHSKHLRLKAKERRGMTK